MKIYYMILIPVALTGACTSTSSQKMVDPNDEPGSIDVIICQQPRPQLCTQEYNPVCATLSDGRRQTYATGCTSCADVDVKSYQQGACSTDVQAEVHGTR